MVELGVARRARLALHPSTQPEVIASSEHVLRERIARHGIIADVALRLPSNERGWATLRIYVEGRVIETLSLTSDQFPMPLDAAFEAPALLPPLRDYSGVAREKLGEVFNVLLGTAMKLLRANGERLAKERPDWLFGYVCLAAGALGPSALDEIPCVPCLGKTLASLSQLRKGPVAWVPESISADRRAVDDRLVIHCSESQLSLMPNVVTFPYERFLGPRDDATLISALADIVARHRSEASPGAFAVRVELPHGRAYAALSNQSCLLRAHAGVIVDSVPHDSGPMAIVLDDHSMSLGAERVGVPLPSDRSSVRLAACALAAECLGVRAPSSRIPLVASSSTAPDPLVLPFLLAFLSSEGSAMSPEIRAGARNFPCFTALDHEGKPQRISIVELELAHSADIPFLTEVPGFRTLAWKPLVAATDHERAVFTTLSGRMLRSGDGELAARYKQASAWAAKSELLQRPIIDFRSLLPNARPDAPVLRRDEPDSTRIALGLAATPSEGLRLQVLFRGRVFTETVLPEIPVQCTARVSINDETHLETGSKLSEKGQSSLHRVLLETLTSYFEMSLGESEAGLQDGSTLKIGLVVMSRGHRARIKEAVRGSRQPVATVQGPLVPLADLLKEATRYGTVAFPAWPSGRTRSPLDEPTIHIGADARGESLKALLFAVDVKLVDVSDELLDIVSRRSKGPSAAPTLPGIAPHAALRMSLTQLRVTRAEGEVELLRGPTSTISVDDGSGALKSLDQLGVSVRAAYPMNLAFRLEGRATRANIEEALREIHLAIGRRLRGFSEDLDGLPPYVRDHVRTLIRLTLAKGNKISKNLLKAQVFIDCDGKYHSMTEIAARTTPFSSVGPSSRGEGDCLVLTDLELDVFDEALGLRPELPATVPESIRAHALIVQSFSGVAGECALLPNGTSVRTIITRRGRVVAELEPSTLWPVYARIEDKAGLSAEVHHKGLPEEKVREYRSLIDSTIGAAFEARLGEQAGSICRVALVDGVQVAAQLSLGLEKHEVTVTLPGAANLPLVAQGELSSPKVMCPIPVTGRAYIGTSAEMVPSILSKVAAKAFVALLEGAPNEAEARAYAALLGLGLKAAPSAFANSVHARQISVAEVRRELGKNGFLWVSKAWTATEGRVVLDRSCPLVRALDRWAPFLICDVSQDPVRLEAKVASTKNRPSVEPASSVTPGRPLYAEPPMTIAPLPTLEEAAPRTEPLGWTERIMAFFGRSPSMSVPEDARIQRVLVETLLKHPLVNPPVLRYVAKGRAVRFDASSRSLQVRTDLAKQSEVVVVAAALAEINEVLDEVTDVEERRILLFLLSKIRRVTPGGAPLKSRSRASSKAPRGSSSG